MTVLVEHRLHLLAVVHTHVLVAGLAVVGHAELIGEQEVVVGTQQQSLALAVAQRLGGSTTELIDGGQCLIGFADALVKIHPQVLWRVIAVFLVVFPEIHQVALTVTEAVLRAHVVHIVGHQLVLQQIAVGVVGSGEQSGHLAVCVHLCTVVGHLVEEV